MLGRRESLRDLIRNQHEETLRFQRESKEWFRAEQAETREFNREILLRNEKVYTALIAQIEEGREEIRANTEQVRANTQAVLSVLDRLEGGAAA
jgi:RNA polymerase-binding transcription factor DksA